jgi:hypothetical protein
MIGNDIDEDIQWRKLELVGRVADRLWGGTGMTAQAGPGAMRCA